MDTSLLLKGLLIGFSIAAPVGPIGVLCIRRTLAQGRTETTTMEGAGKWLKADCGSVRPMAPRK